MTNAFAIVKRYEKSFNDAHKNCLELGGGSQENIQRYSECQAALQAAQEVFIASYGSEAYASLSNLKMPKED